MSQLKCPEEFQDEPNALWQMRVIGPQLTAAEGYAIIARAYDQDFAAGNYDAPRLVCEALFRMFPPEQHPRSPHQLHVLDVAAGTGQVGRLLHECGVRHLDALDPSAEMRSVALERKVYRNYVQCGIGHGQTPLAADTYDAVVCAGGFVQGHCPPEAFDEMIRVCKPGGYVINSMRFEYLVTVPEYHRLEKHMDMLEEKKLWRRVDRYVTDRYFFEHKQGINYIYQKL